jgi:potassium-dependent mechanosensitive channel
MFSTLARIWTVVTGVLGTPLFSIGGTPVTTGGVVRVLVTLAIAALISRALRAALARVARHWPDTHRAALYTLSRVIHYSVLTLGAVVGLSTIGVDFTNLAVLLGALGIGIGFGLQDVVANFLAGLLILFERHVRVGDFIELESGVSGEVREIRMRATRLTTPDNIDILVPNSAFIKDRVVNWTLDEADRRIHVAFGVAYGSDKEQVRAAGLEAADRVMYTLKGLPGRAPQVWLVGFGDSSLDFELIVWVTVDGVKRPNAAQAAYLWELHTALAARGIEIPFPQRDVHVRSLFGLEGEAARRVVEDRATAPPRPPTSPTSS